MKSGTRCGGPSRGMRRLWVLVTLAPMLALGACKDKQPAPREQQPAAAFDAAAPAPKKKPKVDTAALRKTARETVDRWLAAQNDGDFAAYSRLYGERFSGVRRSGVKRVELDRAGWLADRKRMFSKPTRVEISDVEIRLQASRAHVRFVQRWASAAYEDIGPKRLVIDLESKAIVKEEMISSTIVSSLNKAGSALEIAAEDVGQLSCEDLPNDSERVVCVVDTSDDELSAEYTVALLRKGPQQWTVLEKSRGSVQATEMKYSPTNTASVDSWLEEIAGDKYALAVTAESESEGGWGPDVDDPGGHERKVATRWFAIEGDQLREVLSVDGGGSSDLDYRGEFVDVSVEVTERVTDGYYTLNQTSTTTAWGDEVGHGMYDPKVETSTSELRWDPAGRVYQ